MKNQAEEIKKTENKDTDGLEMLNMDDIGKKKRPKATVFDYVRYGIMLAAAIVFVVAGYNIYSILKEYSKGEKTYEQVIAEFEQDEVTGAVVEATGEVVQAEGFVRYYPNFASLQTANSDVIGWIQFEGIAEINYPILQHPSDNDFYLKKMWNKEENTAGSIFADVNNSSDFQDANTFIYGHNMKNLSMFGRLKEYKEQAFFAGKEFFWIYTPTANYKYQIYSVHESKVDSGMFKTFEEPSDEFTQYVTQSKEASRYNIDVEVTGEDKIVTLSTCTPRGDNWRLLVQAKLVGTEYLQ